MRAIPDERGRCVVRCQEAERRAVPAIDIPERGVANADRILQHGCKYRLRIAGKAADDLKNLLSCRLSLQRFVQFTSKLSDLCLFARSGRIGTCYSLARAAAFRLWGLAT